MPNAHSHAQLALGASLKKCTRCRDDSVGKIIVKKQLFAYVLAPQTRWRIFWKVNALFIYHRNYGRKSRQAAKQKSRVWQYHLSVRTAELLILLLSFYLEVCFSLFSNKCFNNIGLAITFASEKELSMLPSVWREKIQSCNNSENQPEKRFCYRYQLLHH